MLSMLLVVLSQAPAREVVVVITDRREAATSDQVAQRVGEALRDRGLTVHDAEETAARLAELGTGDPGTCNGSRTCLSRLAATLGTTQVVVGVAATRNGRLSGARLEAMTAGRPKPLAAARYSAGPRRFEATTSVAAELFALQLANALVRLPPLPAQPAAPEPLSRPPAPQAPEGSAAPDALATPAEGGPPDADRSGTLAPLPPPPLVMADSRREPLLKWAGLSLAGAGAAAALAFTLSGMDGAASYRATLRDFGGGTSNASTLSRSALEAQAKAVNIDFTVALSLALASAAVVAVAIWLFATDLP